MLLLVAAGVLVFAPAGHAAKAANLSLTVTFTANGVVTVTLPDGTPVGSTSGAPTVIPAGYYTLNLFGPGECINLPLFSLKGPGVNIEDDMRGGEVEKAALEATFLPNSTYTWHLDKSASIVHTFRTSSDVTGTPTVTPSTTPKSSSSQPTSEDVVGSALLPLRGTLKAGVSAKGLVTLSYKGKSVTHLKPGRYTFAVDDRSSTLGFLVEKLRGKPKTVTGTTFVGKRSLKLSLSAGKWFVMPKLGKSTYTIVVG
jgi:hypothetical protein